MWCLGVYVGSLIIILVTRWIYIWRNPRCNGKLPPGSLGLPLIGESLQLLLPSHHTVDIHPFLKYRFQRYGSLFRTNVAGRNVVVSCDQEFNHFVFQQDDKLVERCYLDLFETLFTKRGAPTPHNRLSFHKYIRNTVLNQFGSDCIKKNLLSMLEQLVQTTILSWSSLHDHSIELESALVSMFGEFGAKQLYSYDPENVEEFVDMFINISTGILAFPLNVPGTTYYKCLKDKDKLMKIIEDIVKARLAAHEHENEHVEEDDCLSKIIEDMKKIDFLTQDCIVQLLYALSFATFHIVPTVLVFALKFISDSPFVLHELIGEHEEILKKRETLSSSVTWEEYKSMTFTHQVINETLRLANVGTPGAMRRAIKDIKVKGYTIPAGWRIMVCHSAVHLNPDLYKNPLKFDPWRWQNVTSEYISKNLTPFGEGVKQCAGADFSKASICIFLHVLVTKYRWSVVKGGDAIQDPILHFKNGLHITITKRDC